ncbi:rhomboid family intramembrane serine protease [Hugenholtzia roseola]|uniref:rhomboid family intramembrane serine protease n=1 Tax=Hugenholtzia roseola TaxID=1002 RepID=UPI00047D8478|nr:rhomboid family intramembrane serine protease [Hugenholtzia roseola]
MLTIPILSSISVVILALTVILSLIGFQKPDIQNKLIYNPYRVHQRGEYYRFLSSGFIHANFLHLFFNMFSFILFALQVETVYIQQLGAINGRVLFVAMYLFSIVISDLPSYFKYKDKSYYNSLGASGGVSAIVFAAILFNPTQQIMIYFIPLPGFILGILYLIYSYFQARNSNDNINHSAHLWGAVFGFIVSAALIPSSLQNFVVRIIHWF